MSLLLRCAAISTLLLTGFAACSTSQRGFDPPPRPLVDSTDAATDSAPAPSCEGHRCSRDLHQVLDSCTDGVVETCSADRACGAGKCVSPCEASALAQGSLGCSFWTTPPDAHIAADVSCFAAFIANTWSTPVTLKASFGREPIDISRSIYRSTSSGGVSYERIEGPIPPGEVGIVFLSQGVPRSASVNHIDCPAGVDVAFVGNVATAHATSIYEAFHIETDVPVSAYSIYPYGGANSYVPSATLLLPTSSWGTNYLLVDGYEETLVDNPPFVQIVAQEDDTVLRVKPRSDIREGNGVVGIAKGNVGSWTLQRGQVLELRQSELAGTPLESNHPVAVFGGIQCVNVPRGATACDTLHQQITPISQWGSSYSAVPYKSRTGVPEQVVWRIGAARDGTTLTYDPVRPVGAPDKLSSGELLFFTTEQLFSVHSQDADHPIYLANLMTGNSVGGDGDPDFVNVVPDEQFLDSYVFFVDPTYANSTLTVVRKKDSKGFHDVTVDCAGVVSGWQPLGSSGTVEYTWLDLTRYGNPVPTASGTCGAGRHESSSDGPFGLYVWGLDYCASYGYPAGAGSRVTTPFRVVVQ